MLFFQTSKEFETLCCLYISSKTKTSLGEVIMDLNPALYEFVVGEVDYETDKKLLEVERVVLLDYEDSILKNDIALLKLKKPLSFNDKVRL